MFPKDETELIPKLEYPKVILPILKSNIHNKIINGIKNGILDKESCSIPMDKLEKYELIPYWIFKWMADNCGVFDNLNMILCDLEILGNSMNSFKGSPRKRFYLLVRTYFSEFYRFKDIYSIFLNKLKHHGLIDKKAVTEAKKLFLDEFNIFMSIRNRLVHQSINWKGEPNFDLNLVGMSNELGYLVLDEKSGRLFELQDILRDITIIYIDILEQEAHKMRNIIQTLLNTWADILKDYAK
ncbi:MAG: hypothetical protein NTY36_02995 [Deltaproteobacteria bacterium]|nr:hypothetical protein [Deltaproteobacteria bacterium]